MKRNLLLCRNCLFISFILVMFAGCDNKENDDVKPPQVVIAKVRSQKITESTTIVGEVAAKNKVSLRARVIGFLEKRNFREGSFVKKGDLLFQIEKTKYQAEVESARAQLETAEANLKNRLIDFDRQKYLVNKDAVAKMNYDLAECEKSKAEAEVLAGKAALKEANLRLSYTDIYAPFDGKIGKSEYSVGNLVSPNSKPLALLTMVNPITVEFNISESLLVTLAQYAEKEDKLDKDKKHVKLDIDFVTVKLILANGTDYPIKGLIDFVDNVINPMTGTILVRAEFKNPSSILTPGAYVNVVIESNYKKERLLIPQASIQEDQTGEFVMMLNKKDEVVKKTIKTGSMFGTDIVVLEGLKLNDQIIKEGLQKVRSGMKVTPVEDIFAQSHSASTTHKELKEKASQEENKKNVDVNAAKKIDEKSNTEELNKNKKAGNK
jgi:membrane fusion protein, multidrug efflux system